MEDIRKKIDDLSTELESFRTLLDIEAKRARLLELQAKMAAPNFWQDQKAASRVVDELKSVKSDIDSWSALHARLLEGKELLTLGDPSYEQELSREITRLLADFEKLRLRVLFNEKFDDANAIVEINAGAGGTEACDWTDMLFRMYFRWAEDKKFTLNVLEELKGEEAGIKNITFIVEGLRAYGMLRCERGVHRLVRVSPFDANKRRHTSFASVGVLPEIADDAAIELNPEDLRIETFRAGGKGGQHVNKTDSAVRIIHIPTGIVTGSQNERSQHQNKQVALRVLKAKLFERQEEERKKALEKISGTKKKIEWGSQIRSYVLYPYLLVKDHRTDFESHDAWGVLDGKFDDFIYAYLKMSRT